MRRLNRRGTGDRCSSGDRLDWSTAALVAENGFFGPPVFRCLPFPDPNKVKEKEQILNLTHAPVKMRNAKRKDSKERFFWLCFWRRKIVINYYVSEKSNWTLCFCDFSHSFWTGVFLNLFSAEVFHLIL